MVKRLTMLMGGLILSTGIALAQTTVTGKVISQEDGETVIVTAFCLLDSLCRPKTKKRKNSCLISCCGRGIPTISSRRRFGRWRNGGESKWLFISEK